MGMTCAGRSFPEETIDARFTGIAFGGSGKVPDGLFAFGLESVGTVLPQYL